MEGGFGMASKFYRIASTLYLSVVDKAQLAMDMRG
jgi:hypothetical protein